jgi:large subunit ribosomal protein L15
VLPAKRLASGFWLLASGIPMSMIHDITSVTRRNKKPIRKGRGRSAGHGKTAGRGGKGSSARQGSPHWVPGHEGGQTKLFLRFPKRGFSNDDFARRFHIVNLGELERFDNGATVDAQALITAGLVPDEKLPVKILGDGKLTKKLTVHAGWYSKSAHEKITGAGGSAQNLKGEAFEFPKPKKKFVKREGEKKKKAAPAAEEGAAAPAAAAPAQPEGEAPAAPAADA